MASRNIGDLSPEMQVYFNKANDKWRRDLELQKTGIHVILTCTYRSAEEQDKLYAQGRTAPGNIVTRARAGKSKHNTTNASGEPAAEAFDIALLQHGKLLWDNTPDGKKTWEHVGAMGESVGLKWYGNPSAPFREGAHFQNPNV